MQFGIGTGAHRHAPYRLDEPRARGYVCASTSMLHRRPSASSHEPYLPMASKACAVLYPMIVSTAGPDTQLPSWASTAKAPRHFAHRR